MISNVLQWEKRSAAFTSLRSLSEKAAKAKETQSTLETSNPYYNKYKDKIARLKKEKPELFLDKLTALKIPEIESESSIQNSKFSPKDLTASQKTPALSCPSNFKGRNEVSSNGSQEISLDKIMRVDLLKELPSDEIGTIWKKYHADKNFVCALITQSDYQHFQELMRNYPTFLLALPKTEGFEFIYSQGQFLSLLFTKLSSFQMYKENAPIILSLNFYTDLAASKEIVLMRGEYNADVLMPIEAQTLVNQHQLFYNRGVTDEDRERLKLVQTFNSNPDKFDYNELLKYIPGYGNS